MQETKATFKNQEASIRNLELQVGQLAKQFIEKPKNALPNDTILNPKEACKVINLRSGKVVGKEVMEDANNKQYEEAMEDSILDDAQGSNSPIQSQKGKVLEKEKVKEYEPKLPFPQRFQKENKDNKF
ncbi:hypothetical protein AHAS_Ahas15G0259400 [Arachis hypogaea]